MPTEELQLWTNDPMPRQIREQLMAEEMGINALRNPSGQCVLFDELPEPSCRVRTVPRQFKQVCRPLRPLAFHVLGEFPTEALGKEDVAILVPLALRDPQMRGLQINVREAQPNQFCIADARKQQVMCQPFSGHRLSWVLNACS